jgi:hypothetical protein
MSKSAIINDICKALSSGDLDAAKGVLQDEYPFVDARNALERVYTATECTRVFIRDGFIDRYSGTRMVFPGTLRLLSLELGNSIFPFQANGRIEITHPAFWELYPTVDHSDGASHGSHGEMSNLITANVLTVVAKRAARLQSLSGWKMAPAGNFEHWDGTIWWFVNYVARREDLLRNAHLMTWFQAARSCLS